MDGQVHLSGNKLMKTNKKQAFRSRATDDGVVAAPQMLCVECEPGSGVCRVVNPGGPGS